MKTDTLKKSLLDYAIKGKLTAKFRRENSELSAFDELEIYNDKIREKRKNLEKELKKCEKEFKLEKDKDKKAFLKQEIQTLKKELTKCKEITPLNFSEAPFTIPNSWAWVKLGDITSLQNGYAFKAEQFSNNGIPIIKIGDIQQGKINLANCVFLNNENIDDFKDYQVAKNDILIAMSGATTGKVGIYTDERLALLNQRVGLLRIENTFLRKYIYYFLTFYSADNLKQSAGSAQPNLSTQQINATFIPLPPLCEQQEIVKKLDLLVTLANDFAITKENLKRIEKRIEKSLLKLALEGSLSKLYRRSSPTLSAFNEITTYNEAVKEKRKNLEKELNKCEKEFKLEKDKDKKAFLKQEIQTLKKELTKCKEITPLNLSEAPFEIPNSWAWVKLGDICEMKKGPFGSAITKDMFIPNGNNAVKIYEQKNAIQKSETLGEYYISLEHFEKLKQFEVFENDIIVSCAGTIGEIFRIPKNAPKGIINQALMKIKLVNEEWIPYFMIFFDFLIKQKSQENSKGSAIKNIPPLDILKNFSIPLPPLCEQEHIVQTLDTLFTFKKGLGVD
ncbi:restriction endonuclease subunit S [Campylobacter upsaliensis]|uniref:restriction endonuclease subunit S n=1 Tax=Campylobacter upsaliensis TaxID=28080 RepID=UPI0022EA3D9C|nr:restriction endonuclease subunit S [Campylobacter upsaliensis]